jgi:hypothetical protein
MENRGINNSKPCISHERNLAYSKSRAGQKICLSNIQHVSHNIALALRRSKSPSKKAHETA